MKEEESAKKGDSIRGLSAFSFGTVELGVGLNTWKAGKEGQILDEMFICTWEDKRVKS